MINSNVTTPTLVANTPMTLEFSGAYPYYWINNLSDGDVYASLADVPVPGADGTYTVPSGGKQRVDAGIAITNGIAHGKITLLGEGTVQVSASLIAECPFNSAAGGGEIITGSIDQIGYISIKLKED